MKKIFLAIVAVVCMGTMVNAQNWIGVRGAFGSGSSAELSAQWGLGANRLETDLGWNTYHNGDYGYINLTAIYQWRGAIVGNLGWYAGVGANVGLWNGNRDGLGLGFDAQLGIEYNFSIPLQVTLDVRPQYDIIGYSGFGYFGALGLRFRF